MSFKQRAALGRWRRTRDGRRRVKRWFLANGCVTTINGKLYRLCKASISQLDALRTEPQSLDYEGIRIVWDEPTGPRGSE